MANLIGQKFNRLLVLEKTSERKAGSIVWKCLCDCGNIAYVSSRNLKSGNTKSCGCLNNEKRIERIQKYNLEHFIDLSGTKKGKLTILEPTTLRSGGRIIWKCLCECGNICYVSANNLEKTQSCGCLKYKNQPFKDITGQKFGKLTVLEKTEQRKHGNIVWKCLCDCGNICYIQSASLIHGLTKSCGCLKSQGEEKIIKILQENNIYFEKEKTFDSCRFDNSNSLAKFDFYINNSYIIEFDGVQHFKQMGWESLSEIQYRDICKNKWCKENNIPIIRIPYTHYENLSIKDLLLETSAFIITEQQLKDLLN